MIILVWLLMILFVISLVFLLILLDEARLMTKQEKLQNRKPEPEPLPGLSWWEVHRILKQMEREQKKYFKSKRKVYWGI